MEKLLTEFVDTLDISLKKLQKEASVSSGISKLTISQLQYIDAIGALGEPTITEVADKLDVTKPSTTIAVKKLIKMGYVQKTQSSEDRRIFHVTLTGAGKQLVKAKYQALKEYGDFIRSALSEDEALHFEKTITKLVQLFKSG